jgi:CheY-like chemotaxis protein
LTSVITHDFNNFLTGILGGCELTEFELPDDSPALPHIALVKNTAERARVLTRGLLAYTRRGSESYELFDLNGMLGDLKAILNQVVGSPITVTVDLDPHPLPLRMALSEMEQVVMNLVVNARDALQGGGTISLRTDRRVDPESGEETALLEVSDTGVGMDEATVERIFESFFTTKREGTGIGLSTVLGIVEQSEGRIEVDSTPGEGTTFTVSLPLAEEMGARASTTARAAARNEGAWEARKGRILVVEDDDAVRRVMVTALGRVGYDVDTAHSAEEALEHLAGKSPTPDLLLSDISLPGRTGTDLAADFRGMHPDVPILLATGYAERSAEIEESGVRPDGFLRKPFSIEELVAEVRRCLDIDPVSDENGGTRAS